MRDDNKGGAVDLESSFLLSNWWITRPAIAVDVYVNLLTELAKAMGSAVKDAARRSNEYEEDTRNRSQRCKWGY